MNMKLHSHSRLEEHEISAANARFWNEMCGTNLFRELGLTSLTKDSLTVFDHWYFAFYPYLLPWLRSTVSEDMKVLEVGLGFGSVSQVLALSSASYIGIDIAEGPVSLVNYRLLSCGLPQTSVRSSVLSLPVESESVDAVVAIGSLHHVGDFEGALQEVRRVLKPGGKFVGMVYSAYTLRSFYRDPKSVVRSMFSRTSRGRYSDSVRMRSASDRNQSGDPAPFTEFFSRRALRSCLNCHFGHVRIRRRNVSALPIIGQRLRRIQLLWPIRTLFSLDLYFEGVAGPDAGTPIS